MQPTQQKTRARLRVILGAIAALTVGAAAPLAVPPAAQADTNVSVAIEAIAVGEDIVGGTLRYDPAKHKSGTPYQIGYEGRLDMGMVWTNYKAARSVFVFKKILEGNTAAEAQALWGAKTLEGSFEINFTIDPSVVSVDPSFISPEAVQKRYEEGNPGTPFTQYMKATDVSYDPNSGEFRARFQLQQNGTPGVLAGDIDQPAAQPKSLRITSPHEAFHIMPDDFVPGRSFTATSPQISGSVTIAAMYLPQLPINFSGTAGPVSLEMVNTHAASYAFESATPTLSLPATVTALLPNDGARYADGETATPVTPSTTGVEADGGRWVFDGWDVPSVTIAGHDVRFTGRWHFEGTIPDASLAIALDADPAPGSIVHANDTITYRLTAKNTGKAALTDVALTNELSGVLLKGTKMLGAAETTAGKAPDRNGSTLTWEGALNAGESVTITYRVAVGTDLPDEAVLRNRLTSTATNPRNPMSPLVTPVCENSPGPECEVTHTVERAAAPLPPRTKKAPEKTLAATGSSLTGMFAGVFALSAVVAGAALIGTRRTRS